MKKTGSLESIEEDGWDIKELESSSGSIENIDIPELNWEDNESEEVCNVEKDKGHFLVENILDDEKHNISVNSPENVLTNDLENENMENADKISVEYAENILNDDAENVLNDDAKNISVDNTENILVDNAENISVDNAENILVDNAENISVDNAENISVDNAENISVNEAQISLNIDAENFSIDDAENFLIDNVKNNFFIDNKSEDESINVFLHEGGNFKEIEKNVVHGKDNNTESNSYLDCEEKQNKLDCNETNENNFSKDVKILEKKVNNLFVDNKKEEKNFNYKKNFLDTSFEKEKNDNYEESKSLHSIDIKEFKDGNLKVSVNDIIYNNKVEEKNLIQNFLDKNVENLHFENYSNNIMAKEEKNENNAFENSKEEFDIVAGKKHYNFNKLDDNEENSHKSCEIVNQKTLENETLYSNDIETDTGNLILDHNEVLVEKCQNEPKDTENDDFSLVTNNIKIESQPDNINNDLNHLNVEDIINNEKINNDIVNDNNLSYEEKKTIENLDLKEKKEETNSYNIKNVESEDKQNSDIKKEVLKNVNIKFADLTDKSCREINYNSEVNKPKQKDSCLENLIYAKEPLSYDVKQDFLQQSKICNGKPFTKNVKDNNEYEIFKSFNSENNTEKVYKLTDFNFTKNKSMNIEVIKSENNIDIIDNNVKTIKNNSKELDALDENVWSSEEVFNLNIKHLENDDTYFDTNQNVIIQNIENQDQLNFNNFNYINSEENDFNCKQTDKDKIIDDYKIQENYYENAILDDENSNFNKEFEINDFKLENLLCKKIQEIQNDDTKKSTVDNDFDSIVEDTNKKTNDEMEFLDTKNEVKRVEEIEENLPLNEYCFKENLNCEIIDDIWENENEDFDLFGTKSDKKITENKNLFSNNENLKSKLLLDNKEENIVDNDFSYENQMIIEDHSSTEKNNIIDEIIKDEINEDEIIKDEIIKDEINKEKSNEDEINEDEINEDEINEDEIIKDNFISKNFYDCGTIKKAEFDTKKTEHNKLINKSKDDTKNIKDNFSINNNNQEKFNIIKNKKVNVFVPQINKENVKKVFNPAEKTKININKQRNNTNCLLYFKNKILSVNTIIQKRFDVKTNNEIELQKNIFNFYKTADEAHFKNKKPAVNEKIIHDIVKMNDAELRKMVFNKIKINIKMKKFFNHDDNFADLICNFFENQDYAIKKSIECNNWLFAFLFSFSDTVHRENTINSFLLQSFEIETYIYFIIKFGLFNEEIFGKENENSEAIKTYLIENWKNVFFFAVQNYNKNIITDLILLISKKSILNALYCFIIIKRLKNEIFDVLKIFNNNIFAIENLQLLEDKFEKIEDLDLLLFNYIMYVNDFDKEAAYKLYCKNKNRFRREFISHFDNLFKEKKWQFKGLRSVVDLGISKIIGVDVKTENKKKEIIKDDFDVKNHHENKEILILKEREIIKDEFDVKNDDKKILILKEKETKNNEDILQDQNIKNGNDDFLIVKEKEIKNNKEEHLQDKIKNLTIEENLQNNVKTNAEKIINIEQKNNKFLKSYATKNIAFDKEIYDNEEKNIFNVNKDDNTINENKNNLENILPKRSFYQQPKHAQSFADFFTQEPINEEIQTKDDTELFKTYINDSKEEIVKKEEVKKEEKKESFFSFSRLFGAKKKVYKVKLESDASFVYDNETKKWVNKNEINENKFKVSQEKIEKAVPVISKTFIKNENKGSLSGRYAGFNKNEKKRSSDGFLPDVKNA